MPIPITPNSASNETLRQLLERVQDSATEARQRDAERRLSMLRGDWLEYVQEYIGNTYTGTDRADLRAELMRRCDRSANILRRICHRVCVAYKVPPVRKLEGASEDQSKAFANIVDESRIKILGQRIEQYAWALNVCLVVPRVVPSLQRGGKPRVQLELVPPHRAEVFLSSEDPTSIELVVYQRRNRNETNDDPFETVIVDSDSFKHYTSDGKLIRVEYHGAGVVPVVDFRLTEPGDDWWSSDVGSEVVDATLAAAHVVARMVWVRSMFDRRREILMTRDSDKVPRQFAGGVITIPLDPSDASYSSMDAIVPIDEFEKHVDFYLRQAAESLGVPSSLVSSDGAIGIKSESKSAQDYFALSEIRRGHISHLEEGEARLWSIVGRLLGEGKHPAAAAIGRDLIPGSFAMQFPDLTFAEHPAVLSQVWKSEIELGITSTVDVYMAAHPGLTREEAAAQVKRVAEEEGELNQFYVTRNLPRDPSQRRQTIAQMQGQQGGETSGVVRRRAAEVNNGRDQRGRGNTDNGNSGGQ